MSILNSLKGMVTNELVSGLAGHLGESNDGISKAVGGILPSLLGGLMNTKQEDHSMLGGLLSQAGNLAGGGNLVGDLLGGLTGGNANSGISGIGSSLVSGLLGNKMGGVVDLISKFAGVKSGSSSSLLGIGGSLLASFLGKKMLGDGLNFSSLLNLIGGEKKEIAAAMPSGFSSALGLGNLFSDVNDKVAGAATTVSNAANTVANVTTGGDDSNSGGGMKWLWPLLLLGALAAGIMWYMKGCGKEGTDDAVKTEETSGGTTSTGSTEDTTVHNANTATVTGTDAGASTSTTKTTTTTTSVTPAVESIKVKLSNGTELNANKGGVEDKLVAFMNDPGAKANPADKKANWFDFDNLNFDLGKATITKGSMIQIENLAAILKAYPNMKIKVGGYTDKKGDDAANMKLSQSRADAVFAALKAKGANAAQLIAAEGYGETLATVAESASDEERRKDRRTAVRVDSK